MQFKTKIFVLIWINFSLIAFSEPWAQDGSEKSKASQIQLDTKGVMERAIEHNYGVRINKILASRSLEDLREYNSIFDTEAFGDISFTRDEMERTSNLFSDNDSFDYGIGLRKRFITGTNLEVSWGQNRSEEDTPSFFTTINPYHETKLNLLFRQPLLKNAFGLTDRGSRDILQTNIERTRTDITNNIEQLLSETLQGYWILVLAQERTKIRDGIIKETRNFLKIQKRKYRYGLAEDPDVLQTQISIKAQESDLILANKQLRDIKETFRVALAYPIGTLIEPVDRVFLPDRKFTEEDSKSEIKIALENSRELRQLDQDIKANQVAIRLAKNSYWPQLDLVASLQNNGIDPDQAGAISRAYRYKGWFYTVGGELSIPLEQRSARADKHRALLDRTSLLIQVKQNEDRIVDNVGNAFREVVIQFQLAEKNWEITELSKKRYKAEIKRFNQGRSTSDLLNRNLLNSLEAELAAAESSIAYQLALVKLKEVQNLLIKEIDLDNESRRILR